MQWSFSNKDSRFLSFNSSQEERPSSGFMTIPTLDSLDVHPKSQVFIIYFFKVITIFSWSFSWSGLDILQKTSLEKQGSSHYPMAAYSLQQFGVRSHETRMFPFSIKQPSSSNGQNIVCSSSINQSYLGGGVPVTPPVSVFPTTASGSFVGFTDIR